MWRTPAGRCNNRSRGARNPCRARAYWLRRSSRGRRAMSAGPGGVVDLDRETVKRGLADSSLLLVDVREPNEFAAGHIPGSVSHPLSTFDPMALPAAAEGQRI